LKTAGAGHRSLYNEYATGWKTEESAFVSPPRQEIFVFDVMPILSYRRLFLWE
jgi:hypothetical protein